MRVGVLRAHAQSEELFLLRDTSACDLFVETGVPLCKDTTEDMQANTSVCSIHWYR